MTRFGKLKFAAHHGVSTLYKFRAFDTDAHRDWVRQILLENKVWFSRPSELNDPDDLRPIVRLRPYDTERELREALVENAKRMFARQSPPLEPSELHEWIRRAEQEPLEVLQARVLNGAHARLEKEYWIFSLCANLESFRMWRDYADRGRGLCIHFDATPNSPFCFAQPVIYSLMQPHIPFPFGEPGEFAALALRTKAWRRWHHEREYRFIKYADTPFDEVGLTFEGQYGLFPPAAVTGITVGADMPSEDTDAIIALVRQRELQIPVFRPHRISMTIG